jgi:hypothetical protein
MRHRGIPSILSVLVAGAALLGAAPVHAEVGFAVTPALLELEGRAGDTGSVDITVANRGDEPFDAATDIIPFQDMTGDRSAVDWSNLRPRALRVEPGESATATFDVTIPRDAQSGGRYAALTFSTVPDGADPDAAPISGRIVVPVLLTVHGEGDLVREPTLQRTALFLEPDGRLGARAEVVVAGNVHVPLRGRFEVSGPGPDERSDLTIDLGRVLPGATRIYGGTATLPLVEGGAYELVATMGVPTSPDDAGFEPTLRARSTAVATPEIDLVDPTACEGPDGLAALRVRLDNPGTMGVVTAAGFRVLDASGVTMAAVPVSGQALAWPTERTVVGATLPVPLPMGAYTLVAGATDAMGELLEAQLPFTVGGDAPDALARCAPDVLASPAPPG